MKSLLPAVALVILALGGACSSDKTGGNQAPLGTAGSGGALASSGGHSSTGGSGTGGGSAGGAMPFDCGFDAGADECRVCLGTYCCDDAMSCFGDTHCEAAFVAYQACEKIAGQTDPAKCFSGFNRTIGADGGAADRAGLITCIISSCPMCGGPGVL